MGVNIPNIRIVIHYGPSSDVDDYFQESGRAGRDGTPAKEMLYTYGGCTLGYVSFVKNLWPELRCIHAVIVLRAEIASFVLTFSCSIKLVIFQ